MTAAVLIFLIGVAVASILFHGRELPVLASDLAENESPEGDGLDNTLNSSSSTELLVSRGVSGESWFPWLSLTVLFRAAAMVHLVALMWALVGVFWQYLFPHMKCDIKIKQVSEKTRVGEVKQAYINHQRLLN